MDTTRHAGEPDGLTEAMLAGDPMTQFARWMAEAGASGMPEPTAMVLTTVSAEGRPRARTVLLKAHDQSGFTFYSNRTSRKGQDLAANPSGLRGLPVVRAAPPGDRRGQRAHHVAGGQRAVLPVQAAGYPRSGRGPAGSRRVIASRAELDDRVAELERRWAPPAVSPDARFLGRIPARARDGGVLAGGHVPAARPAALPARDGRRLVTLARRVLSPGSSWRIASQAGG